MQTGGSLHALRYSPNIRNLLFSCYDILLFIFVIHYSYVVFRYSYSVFVIRYSYALFEVFFEYRFFVL